MPSEIRIYFEGNKSLRLGFQAFLRDVREAARARRIAVITFPCNAIPLEAFTCALQDHPNALNLMLVDSECTVAATNPWDHLARREENCLRKPKGAEEHHAHLIVQIMESWFLADKDALQSYYGQGFAVGRLPNRQDVESIPKSEVLSSLKSATQKTRKKGYHKTAHAPDLLGMIDPAKVRTASPWCERLFATVERVIEATQP